MYSKFVLNTLCLAIRLQIHYSLFVTSLLNCSHYETNFNVTRRPLNAYKVICRRTLKNLYNLIVNRPAHGLPNRYRGKNQLRIKPLYARGALIDVNNYHAAYHC